MAEKLGNTGILYRNTGTYGTPVWDAIPLVRDLTLTMEASEADASSRASRFKLYMSAMIEISLEADLIYDPASTDYTTLRDAIVANPPTTVEFAVADGVIATTGTQYLRFHGHVFNLGRSEPLEDAMTNNFMAKPCPNVNANPVFVTTP